MNLLIEIERGVPIPPKRTGRKPGSPACSKICDRYPLDLMAVGESFFIPIATMDERKVKRMSVQVTLSKWGKRHAGQAFIVRNVDDQSQFGLRVWRTA